MVEYATANAMNTPRLQIVLSRSMVLSYYQDALGMLPSLAIHIQYHLLSER